MFTGSEYETLSSKCAIHSSEDERPTVTELKDPASLRLVVRSSRSQRQDCSRIARHAAPLHAQDGDSA